MGSHCWIPWLLVEKPVASASIGEFLPLPSVGMAGGLGFSLSQGSGVI